MTIAAREVQRCTGSIFTPNVEFVKTVIRRHEPFIGMVHAIEILIPVERFIDALTVETAIFRRYITFVHFEFVAMPFVEPVGTIHFA